MGVHLRLREFSAVGRERKLIQLIECHLSAEQSRQRANRREQRRAQEEQRQRIGGRHRRIGPAQAVSHPEDQANRAQHHNIRPVDRAQMEGIGADNMVAVFARVREIELIKYIFSALAIKGELFASFENRLIIVIQLIFGFAQRGHVLVDPRHQHKSAPDG